MFCNRFGVGGYGFSGYGYGGPNIIMMIGVILILSAIVYFIYKTNQSKSPSMAYEKGSPKALEILNERFANGEINEEEYKAKKNQILK